MGRLVYLLSKSVEYGTMRDVTLKTTILQASLCLSILNLVEWSSVDSYKSIWQFSGQISLGGPSNKSLLAAERASINIHQHILMTGTLMA